MEISAVSNTGDGMTGKDIGNATCIMFEEHCVHDPSSSSVVKDGVVYIQE